MKKILVTGGCGYIGSHTVVELVQQGYYPVIVDDMRNSSDLILKGLNTLTDNSFVLYKTDVCNIHSLIEIFNAHEIESVIHFAAYKSVGDSVQNPLDYYQNNLIGLMNILECCNKFQIQKLIFSSSCTVYGQPDSIEVFEDTPKRLPDSPYGFTKWMSEQIISDFSKSGKNLQIICLRYFNPIGAHPSALIGELPNGTPNNLLPYITQTAIGKLQKLTIFGKDYSTKDGTCIRDYIHVCDVAEAHVKALTFQSKSLLHFFNIGTGKGTSVLELVNTFIEVSGVRFNFIFGDRRPGDTIEIFANANLAKEQLNWVAKRNINEALKDAWAWELAIKEL